MLSQTPQTLYDKLWQRHLVSAGSDGQDLIYIDRHIVHEVTSAQAFEGLRHANRRPWRSDSVLATPDHQVPTDNRSAGISGIIDPIARIQVTTLDDNCREFGITQFDINDKRQGIVHVVSPEQGATLPGMTLVCGDSHTSTHGAFATLAQGIGTSEVEHVLATQCLRQRKSKRMRIWVEGELATGVTAKDLILHIIAQVGSAGATGFAVEYAGPAIRALSMEGRMTLCNMSIEMGARCGMVAFDDTTADYLQGRPFAPTGELWQQAIDDWYSLQSDSDAVFDEEYRLDARSVAPQISWGTKPDQVIAINDVVPLAEHGNSAVQRQEWQRALAYMGLQGGESINNLSIDQVFIGSCTNGRIEDIRDVARMVEGHQVAPSVQRAMVVPGSGLVKAQAEAEGLDKIIRAAGFEWRDPGCSMCNAMNPDRLPSQARCASTSNRNFEGRQGDGGRTHLVSPAMAAAAAIAGFFVDIRDWPRLC